MYSSASDIIGHFNKNRTGSVDFVSFDLQQKQEYHEKAEPFLNRMRPRKLIFDNYCGFGGVKRK